MLPAQNLRPESLLFVLATESRALNVVATSATTICFVSRNLIPKAKEIIKQKAHIEPISIKRTNDFHDEELDKKVIYESLKQLPILDVDGKRGKSIYRKLIREIDAVDGLISNNEAYTDFVKTGSVLAKTSMGKKYVPISEVRYADKKVFSDKILKNFNMFDVDSRSGEEKIRKLFGVMPLKYVNAEVDGIPIIHELDGDFIEEYHKFLPFVYACRMGLKNDNQDFNRLKSTKIKKVTGEVLVVANRYIDKIILFDDKVEIYYNFKKKENPDDNHRDYSYSDGSNKSLMVHLRGLEPRTH